MTADPKIARFLDSFPKQWLQLHRVGMFQPDPQLYPEYDPWLEESMVEETTGYFAEMFRNDMPLRQAVDAEWTMLNARLAQHYGLPQPANPELTRTALAPKWGRGGILNTRIYPIADLRRHPVTVPFTGERGYPKPSWRSRLRPHRRTSIRWNRWPPTNPRPPSGHNWRPTRLHPTVFPATPRSIPLVWPLRTSTPSAAGVTPSTSGKALVSTHRSIPQACCRTGRSFANASEFKKLLADDERRLAEAFLEQVATYALRRVMTVDDTEQLHAIAASAGHSDYGVKSLIRGLVLSELFRKR